VLGFTAVSLTVFLPYFLFGSPTTAITSLNLSGVASL
jgi:hypothetical protein